MFGVNWWGLVLPFAYLVVLVSSLITFSSMYRKRIAAKSANLAPWFSPHLQRNIYLSLLHLEPAAGKEKSSSVPESILRAALLRRAVEDIRRIVEIRSAKQACSTLLQRGSVGDDLWQRFLRAEKEMEDELRDVVMEANALAPNWGQTIFQSANEIAAGEIFRGRLDEILGQLESEKEWWKKRRASVQSDGIKEIDTPSTSTSTGKTSDDESVLSEKASNAGSIRKKKGKK